MAGADSESIHMSMLLCNCGCCQGIDAGSEGNKVTLSTRHPILDLCQKDTIHRHCGHGHIHTGLYFVFKDKSYKSKNHKQIQMINNFKQIVD